MQSAEQFRLFAAIPLPDPVRLALAEWAAQHKSDFVFHKWTHPCDLHITLKFMGDTPVSKIEEVCGVLQGAADTVKAFPLAVSRFGSFGQAASPSVFWAGFDGVSEPLRQLYTLIEDGTSALGYAKEDKPYRPHITLARRYAGGSGWDKDGIIDPKPPEPSSWTVERIALYRSHLQRKPMYEEIAGFPLRK